MSDQVRDAEQKTDDLIDVMVRYQRGSIEAFDELYATLSVNLGNYLAALTRNRERAQDLLQETFLQMHRSRHTYTPGRPVKPWAFGIARNVFLMDRRSRTRLGRHESMASEELPEIPVESLAREFPQRDELAQALLQVPEDRREAVRLHHVSGFPFREIGAMLGISERAAKLRAFRGIRDLRRMMVPGGGECS